LACRSLEVGLECHARHIGGFEDRDHQPADAAVSAHQDVPAPIAAFGIRPAFLAFGRRAPKPAHDEPGDACIALDEKWREAHRDREREQGRLAERRGNHAAGERLGQQQQPELAAVGKDDRHPQGGLQRPAQEHTRE
jgi:hypothetical protein